MAVFAQDLESVGHVLGTLAHPVNRFLALRGLIPRLALALFLVIYLPLGFLLGVAWQIC